MLIALITGDKPSVFTSRQYMTAGVSGDGQCFTIDTLSINASSVNDVQFPAIYDKTVTHVKVSNNCRLLISCWPVQTLAGLREMAAWPSVWLARCEQPTDTQPHEPATGKVKVCGNWVTYATSDCLLLRRLKMLLLSSCQKKTMKCTRMA